MAKRIKHMGCRFMLRDVDVKDLVQLLKERIAIAQPDGSGNLLCTVQRENGEVLDIINIEDLFNLETGKNSPLRVLEFGFKAQNGSSFDVQFNTESETRSISYSVEGPQEDWVGNTFYSLDGHLANLSRSTWLDKILDSQYLSGLLFPVLLVTVILQIPRPSYGSLDPSDIRWLEGAREVGILTDTIDFIIMVETMRSTPPPLLDFRFIDLRLFFWQLGIPIAIFVVYYAYHLLPKRGFYWGIEQVRQIDGQRNRAMGIIGFVVVGIMLTLGLNILSNWLS